MKKNYWFKCSIEIHQDGKCTSGKKIQICLAQWNVFQGFVSMWKRRPTTWFCKFLTFSPINWVFLSIQLTFLRHRNSIELKKDSIHWWKCQKIAKSRCRPTFSKRNKTSPTKWFCSFLTFSRMNWVFFQLNWVSMP